MSRAMASVCSIYANNLFCISCCLPKRLKKYFFMPGSIANALSVPLPGGKENRVFDGESELCAFVVDHCLGCLHPQHDAVCADLVIDQMSRVAADHNLTADRALRAQSNVFRAYRQDTRAAQSLAIGNCQPVTAKNFRSQGSERRVYPGGTP